MDPAEFDRLVARARNPRLIPGIYNYCDGRCLRCPFTERCLTYLDNQDLLSEDSDRSVGDTVGESLQRTMEMLAEVAKREGVSIEAVTEEALAPSSEDLGKYRSDPLAVRAREYAHLAWRVGRALAPLVEARGDAGVIEAVETIEWFSSMISAKLYRAICGQAEAWEPAGETQSDCNGSAKVALLGIIESRRAWDVLMETGRATANGVPAQAAAMLQTLEVTVRIRFPLAIEFVRPGLDEPEYKKSPA